MGINNWWQTFMDWLRGPGGPAGYGNWAQPTYAPWNPAMQGVPAEPSLGPGGYGLWAQGQAPPAGWSPSIQPVAPGQFATTPGGSYRSPFPVPGQARPEGTYRTAPPQAGPIEPVPGQYTPSPAGGLEMGPPPWAAPTRATPGRIPVTPVEQALSDVVSAAIGSFGPQQQAIMGQEPQGVPGPWGGQMGSYPVPNITWNRDPRLAEWEQWSWSERGIPLQGYELHRLSRNFAPWGGRF